MFLNSLLLSDSLQSSPVCLSQTLFSKLTSHKCFLWFLYLTWLSLSLELRVPGVSEWVKSLSRVQLFATPWTVAHHAPPSLGLSRQEYWVGTSPGYLPDPGMEPRSPVLQADALTSEPPGKPVSFSNWNRIDLQCYISFRHITQWLDIFRLSSI